MNYNMNKLKLTPIDLMHKLESAERSLMKQESSYHAESSSKPKGKPNGGKRNKKPKETLYQTNCNEEAERQVLQVQIKRSLEEGLP